VIDRFSLTFSEDLAAGTVTDMGNYDLRAAGPDGVFDTADDELYGLASYGYTSGLSASYRITDGPLQPGEYRFVASNGLSDRAANSLDPVFVRSFTVSPLIPYTTENRANDSQATATPLVDATGWGGWIVFASIDDRRRHESSSCGFRRSER
jgi:hypothetical protein